MTRQRPFAAPGTAFLLALLIGCSADTTGPGNDDDDDDGDDPPALVSDRIVVALQRIDVAHDCDPNTSNPGDFQSWVEIWQDADSSRHADDRLLASTPKRTLPISSDESWSAADIRTEILVVRLEGRPVTVRVYVQELDNGVVDAIAEGFQVVGWWDFGVCWEWDEQCMPGVGEDGYRGLWTETTHARDDIFDLFNPDDEGCEFTVTYDAHISEA